MSATKIEWADAVWNPVTGCTPVSDGCKNCYAKRMAQRMRGRFGYPADDPFRPGTVHEDKLDEPLRWRKPRRVFVCSMGDLFHEKVSDEQIAKIWSVMDLCSRRWKGKELLEGTLHTFMILTKRPERMRQWVSYCKAPKVTPGVITHDGTVWPDPYIQDGEGTGIVVGLADSWPLPNVWLGVSVEDQKTANERIPQLLDTPAAVRFVSCEPLLGPVDLEPYLISCVDCGNRGSSAYIRDFPSLCQNVCPKEGEGPGLDWVICGGETGPGARPMHPDWARSLRDQCVEAGVPFFMKKMSGGEQPPDDLMIRQWPEMTA